MSKTHARELADLYTNVILKYIENATGRKNHQYACKYLRRMIKLGARDKANEIILLLRTKYPQRIALMDELNRV